MTEFAAPSDLYFSAVTINLLTLLALPSAAPCLSSHATCVSHYRPITAKSAPPIRCILCIDFVRVTNCFYDYDYDEITVKHVKMKKMLIVTSPTEMG